MRAALRKRLNQLKRQADCWVRGGHFVLVYHRVAEVQGDPWGIAVHPERFDEHLQVLRRYGTLMTVNEMVRRSASRTLPKRAIAITFDDGYADNLLVAKPLLERHDAPATIYLSPELLDGSSPFWWDALFDILMEPTTLPETLNIKLGGKHFSWTGAAEETLSRANMSWRAWDPPPTQRHALFLQLWARLRPLPAPEQRHALDTLSAWVGTPMWADATDRPLSHEEAARLAADGLVEIGAHTLTHTLLPSHLPEYQRSEIAGSKEACEAIAGQPVASFSYPYGEHGRETEALVRDAGFSSACTTAAQWFRSGDDPHRLPRIQPLDWTGAEFERRLATADLF
jgi:peptidoglycan/xylan/chitin deacetylase (PgdA/CDA1 family)